MDHDKRIDKSITFVPVNIAILTVSDSRKADDDRSGDLLVVILQACIINSRCIALIFKGDLVIARCHFLVKQCFN